MKILYAGSPLASALVLKKLIEFSNSDEARSLDFKIAGVLTNPPAARGRHKELIPTEVSRVAKEFKIPLFEFEHLFADSRLAIEPLGADLLVSFDYGRIFGPKFLSLFAMGGINLHPSALPLYRGCTPVPAAILNGDNRLGITVQKIALKTDEGDILAQDFIGLDGTETTLSLMDGNGIGSPVTLKGAELLIDVIKNACIQKKLDGIAQQGESSYTPFIKKEDGLIDWNLKAHSIERKIRAYTPWPLCYTFCKGQKLLILKAVPLNSAFESDVEAGTVLGYKKESGIEIACGDKTVLLVKELQWQGKKAMDYKSFMNGARDFIDCVLVDKI
ncbi:methionyl-tRNA formyltransferase [Treponema pectinovorum]|uniref:methionyl-tRNA formyltransferase n=1 Tax=Treponema pectinovorum TaxID=164 RepID=UPI0011C765D2|nr:methionyl-tRNA formyltransferase [Treponema pectinovorum]